MGISFISLRIIRFLILNSCPSSHFAADSEDFWDVILSSSVSAWQLWTKTLLSWLTTATRAETYTDGMSWSGSILPDPFLHMDWEEITQQ